MTSNTVSVLRNTGTAGALGFAPKADYATGSIPFSVAIGDVDGDGKPDLAVANRNGGTVSVLRNMSTAGTLGFAPKADYATGSLSYSVAIGDVNGDSKPDLAVTNNGSTTVSALRNTSTAGTVSFAPTVDYATGSGTQLVAIGDVDGDGKPDLAVTSGNGATVSVLRNTGTAGTLGFAPKADYATGSRPISVAIGDVDGDGKPDLVTTNSIANTVSVLRQQVLLTGLSLSAGTLSPVFATGTLSYTAAVANATASLTATPTANGPAPSPTVNGTAVASGSASGAIALSVGSNTIAVALDGVSYTLTVTRAAPAPTSLSISTGTLAAPVSIPAGTYTTVTVTATGNAILGGAVSVSTDLTVSTGGSLDTNCQALTGAGSFTLSAGATLLVCDANGISASGATGAVQTTGTHLFDTDASYVYNGTASQGTGTGLPATVRNLTTTNNFRVGLRNDVAVTRTLTLAGAGNLLLDGPGLTLLSSAAGTALVVNSGTGRVLGNVTVQRFIDGSLNSGLGYRHFSAPVANTTVADLATAGFAPEVSQASTYNSSATPGTTPLFPTVFGYDQSRLVSAAASNYAPFDKGFFVPASLGTALTPGQGYAVNIAATQLVDFVGTLNTGDLTQSLARNSGTTAADAGWQLVGNPYPAPLDWSQVATGDRTGLDAGMYVFESSGQYAGAYRSYVNGVGPSSLIGSSQGFFVRVATGNTAGSLTFHNTQRLTDYASQVPVRRGTNDPRPQLRLTLAGATGPADALVLYTETGATPGPDSQFDAVKLTNPSGLNLAAVLATGERLAIDGRPALTAATAVPLFVGVPAPGTYTFAVTDLAHFAPGTRLELVDNLTGTRTALTAGATYAFTTATTTAPGRFYLNLAPAGALATSSAALAAQVQLYPNPARGSFVLTRPAGTGAAAATLLNSLGQVVRTLALPTPETRVDLAGLATGVYTLRLTLGGQPVAKRLVVE